MTQTTPLIPIHPTLIVGRDGTLAPDGLYVIPYGNVYGQHKGELHVLIENGTAVAEAPAMRLAYHAVVCEVGLICQSALGWDRTANFIERYRA